MSTSEEAVAARRTSIRSELASSEALHLRLNAIECLNVAAGIADMGPKFDPLRRKMSQWGEAMLRGEAAILRLVPEAEPRP
jgi:hypothetical protein